MDLNRQILLHRITSFFQQHVRICGTLGLILLAALGYISPIKFADKPLSAQFDILSNNQRNIIETHALIETFWGLTGPMTLLRTEESAAIYHTMEKIRHQNNIRRSKRQKMVRYLVRNFSLTEDNARLLVRSADQNSQKYNLDMELLLAIIFVESTYNPVAESKVGAIGLMQVVPKWHLDKISQYGDVDVLYDIATNIEIGTAILTEYIRKEGNIRTGLHRYNGSKEDITYKYSNRVFEKYSLLKRMTYLENIASNPFDIVGRF